MKKLAEKLKKVDIQLSKYTRKILFEHLMEVCAEFEGHYKFRSNFTSNSLEFNSD